MPPQAPTAPLSSNERPIRDDDKKDLRTPEAVRRGRQKQHKLYGKSCAFTIETDVHAKGYATVSLEAASALGPKEYDWANKLVFQLTQYELPQFVAMLAGHGGVNTMVEFRFHGDGRDKNLRLSDRGDHLLLTLNQLSKMLSVRVGHADTYLLTALCLKALMHNDEHLDAQTVMAMCRRSLASQPLPTA